MTLPTNLVSLAVRGTTQYTKLDQLTTAEHTLRQCGVRSFQQQGGFLPSVDHHSLYTPYPEIQSNPIDHQSLKNLHIIMQDHATMLQEWIQTVCLYNKTLPDEYIPYFLDLGCEHTHLQKWLKLIMSDKAIWLLDHHSPEDWAWYHKIDDQSVEVVIEQDRRETNHKSYQIIEALMYKTFNPHHHTGLSTLLSQTSMWTDSTATSLIKAMFVGNVTASYDDDSLLIKVIRKAGYLLPLKYANAFLAELRTGCDEWFAVADQLEQTFVMRHDILTAIEESD